MSVPIYPFSDQCPAEGEAVELLPGLWWFRLPFGRHLDHINVWLLDDGRGALTVIDCGLAAEPVRLAWQRLLARRPDWRISRILLTHHHGDHAGLAAWLQQHSGAPVAMTARAHDTMSRLWQAASVAPDAVAAFYRAIGVPTAVLTARWDQLSARYGRVMSGCPALAEPLHPGEERILGGRCWQVLVGEGHAPGHALLHDREAAVAIVGDQLLPAISPHVGLTSLAPQADPIGDWFASLDDLAGRFDDDTLILPAHGEPFFGAAGRVGRILHGHRRRLAMIAPALARPASAFDLLHHLFGRAMAERDPLMAAAEIAAHLRHLEQQGRVARVGRRADGADLWQATA